MTLYKRLCTLFYILFDGVSLRGIILTQVATAGVGNEPRNVDHIVDSARMEVGESVVPIWKHSSNSVRAHRRQLALGQNTINVFTL